MNIKPQVVIDAAGRPVRFLMTAGQISEYTGAAARPGSLQKVEWLLAALADDADPFGDALRDKGIKP